MKATTFWRLEHAACSVAAWLITPISLAVVWLTRKVHDARHRAEIQLLYAAARARCDQERIKTRTQR